MTSDDPAAQGGQLKRTLGFRDLLFYGLAYTAPVTPLTMAGFVWDASGGLIALAFLLGALCVYFTANSYAVMTRALPSAGSVYGFASRTMGPFAGFVAGWMILLDYLLVPAFIYALASVSLETLLPGVDRSTWILLSVAITFAINWFGIAVTSRVSLVSVALQFIVVAAVLALVLAALFSGRGSGGLTLAPLFSASRWDTSAVMAATSICVTSYLGFDAVSTLAEEVRDGDSRLVGRAILGNLVLNGTVFVFATWVLGNLLVGFATQDPARLIYELLDSLLGHQASIALAWFLVIAVGVPNVLPMQAGVARVLFAMGRDRTLPAALARVGRRRGNPYVAMLVATAVSLGIALAMRERIGELATVISVGALSGFVFVHLAVLIRFGRAPDGHWWVHRLAPLLGIAAVLAILVNLSAMALLAGGGWLLAGVAYRLFCGRGRQQGDTGPQPAAHNP